MFVIALLSIIAASPVDHFAGSPTFAPATLPTTAAALNDPIFQGPSLSTIKNDWRKDYENLGVNKQVILNETRTILHSHLPPTVTELLNEQGFGTITYVCGEDRTYGEFPTDQFMSIGLGPKPTNLTISYRGGLITYEDGSAVALGPRWHQIPSPVNPEKNGNWAAFELQSYNKSPQGFFTGASYGYVEKVKGGHVPRTCDVVGQRITVNIVATYHLFK